MKRTELVRKTGMKRGGKPRPKKRPKTPLAVSRMMGEWGQAVARAPRCEHCKKAKLPSWVTSEPPVHLEGHHAMRRQIIERLASEAGLDADVIAWDQRWLIVLCSDCHERHTNRSSRLPMKVIPDRAYAMARFLDLALKAKGLPATATIQLTREYADG